MNTKIKSIIISGIIILTTLGCSRHDLPPDSTSDMLAAGTNSFVYEYEPLPDKPLRVFYHIPQGNMATMPIVVVLHGEERNAEDYRDIWIDAANQHQFMVFAPEFTDADFPGGNGYILGNVYTNGNNPSSGQLNPESIWTYSIIEPMFDVIKERTGNTSATYDIYGHSGGGQFVHRFVILKPNARYDKAVASNSGWYTVPDPATDFPYGVASSPAANIAPQDYFSRKLTVQVGALDNNGSDPSIRHNEGADAQGENRLERANYFYDFSQARASSLGTTFNWDLRAVPNAGHDPVPTSADAVNIFFE